MKSSFLSVLYFVLASCVASVLFCFYQYHLPYHFLTSCVSTPMQNIGQNETLGAYYQTSGNRLFAAQLALSLFRRAYKSSPLFLYIDRPDAKQSFWNQYEPLFVMPFDLKTQSSKISGTHFATAAACVSYLKRVTAAAQNVDWLLLLEDDVWVCNSINFSDLKYDMNGQCIAKYDAWGDLTPKIQKKEACYGGYGGFILRGSFVRESMIVDRLYILQILAQIKRPIASDELLSAIFLKSNGTIGKFSGYAESMSSDARPVVVHQMKGFYNHASS